MVFFTSDQHYAHKKILQYENRPWKDTKAMTAGLIAKHNEIVGKYDTVYHLGDVFWGDNWKQLAGILKRLNGKHHLILGNHDRLYVFHYVEAGFLSVHTSLTFEGCLLIHDPAVDSVLTRQPVIHGHTHSLGKRLAPNTFCVCVELWDYYPVPWSKIQVEFGDA